MKWQGLFVKCDHCCKVGLVKVRHTKDDYVCIHCGEKHVIKSNDVVSDGISGTA